MARGARLALCRGVARSQGMAVRAESQRAFHPGQPGGIAGASSEDKRQRQTVTASAGAPTVRAPPIVGGMPSMPGATRDSAGAPPAWTGGRRER